MFYEGIMFQSVTNCAILQNKFNECGFHQHFLASIFIKCGVIVNVGSIFVKKTTKIAWDKELYGHRGGYVYIRYNLLTG